MDTADAGLLKPPPTQDAEEAVKGASAAARMFCGARIGSLRITGLLGEGGLGIVYRAFDDERREVMAVKVLRPEFATRGACIRKFLRGAIAAARIEHPNLVRIHRIGVVEKFGFHYVVMEHLRGRTLQAVLDAEGPLPWRRVLPLLLQAADGLHAAHERSVVHRDVKPDNMILEPEGVVKVTDLGIARTVVPHAATSGLVGTPAFAAPEQYEGRPLDRRADVFGLGATLYYLLSGRLPWDARDGAGTYASMMAGPPRPLADVAPDVPVPLGRALGRMVAARPEGRFRDLVEAKDALLAVLASEA